MTLIGGCAGIQSTISLQNTLTPTTYISANPKDTTDKSSTPQIINENPTMTFTPTEISINLPGSIAYIAHEKTTNIGILDRDLNRVQLVEQCTWCKSLSWSPDGDWIAFPASFADGDSIQIYAIYINSKEVKRITTGPKAKADVSWSPDGDYLLYVEEGFSIDNRDIVKVSLDGEFSQKITFTTGFEYYPTWSPDGKQIAFLYMDERGDIPEIWSMDPDGKNRRRITTPIANYDTLAWSPDSKSILFVSESDCGELLSVNVDNGDLKQLFSFPGCIENPTLSPDGKYIMFIGSNSKTDPLYSANWEITIWDIDSGNLTKIASDQDWRPIISIWDPLMK